MLKPAYTGRSAACRRVHKSRGLMEANSTIDCDLLVVGGGINGAGIARDAAGRGLSVVLCEKDDLGAHTSSASSKLIHGGLRYLEYREFGLVRKALAERETLLKSAPHIMRPLRFVMPHVPGQRPAWLLRAGLFLYDRLAPRAFLPASSAIELAGHRAGAPLKPAFTRAFAYSDGWVDDARLVVLNALDAHEHGARVFTHAACEHVVRRAAHWDARLDQDGAAITVRARPGQCRRPVGGPFRRARRPGYFPPCATSRAAAGQGQPYRRAEAVRAQLRLPVPARRWPGRVRDSV